jgi:ribA/ribD-fused uncharacterized protein
MKNICSNLNENPWRYVLKNNILCFYIGPFSQWWGAYKGQPHPFTMTISDIASIYGFILKSSAPHVKHEIGSRRMAFFEYFETLDKPFTLTFNTAEQAMMFGKAVTFGDFESADKIYATENARTQKELGRQVKNYNDEIWSAIRLKWVTLVNYNKFSQHEDLKNFFRRDLMTKGRC